MDIKKKIRVNDFSSHLFWDVKPGSIDWEKHHRLIVDRVIQRGGRNDMKLLESIYTRDSIKSIIMEIPWLSEKDMAFVHVYFDIPYADMQCYTRKQSVLYC